MSSASAQFIEGSTVHAKALKEISEERSDRSGLLSPPLPSRIRSP
jgi:hypothetical protein